MARAGAWEGEELGWVLVSGFSYFLSLFYLLFYSISYFKHHSIYLNSNSNLNSTLTLNQIKKCTSMNATAKIKPMINFLITYEAKLD